MAPGGRGSREEEPPLGDSPLADVWQLLELAAIHHPHALAVVDAAGPGRQLTYQQLYDRAAALAGCLRKRGVRRGDRLGVLSRNCSHVLELHFAAAALHAVVLNLNIHLAPRELAFILGDASPLLVFADRQYAPSLLAAVEGYAEDCATRDAEPALRRVVWMDLEGPPPPLPATAPAAPDWLEVGGRAVCVGPACRVGGAGDGGNHLPALPCQPVPSGRLAPLHVPQVTSSPCLTTPHIHNTRTHTANTHPPSHKHTCPYPAHLLQFKEYEGCLSGALGPADPAGICAEVLAEGSGEDGYHMYYTSGTTGTPKGVVLSHRIVVQHAVGTIRGGCGLGGVGGCGVVVVCCGCCRVPCGCCYWSLFCCGRSGVSS